jgi:hypothetical protein
VDVPRRRRSRLGQTVVGRRHGDALRGRRRSFPTQPYRRAA